jgi:hypothetical protein
MIGINSILDGLYMCEEVIHELLLHMPSNIERTRRLVTKKALRFINEGLHERDGFLLGRFFSACHHNNLV